MPWISRKTNPAHKWPVYSLKLDPDLHNRFLEYCQNAGLRPNGESLRLLVAAGIDSSWGQDSLMVSTVRANAKAAAMNAFSVLMEELMALYRDPAFDIYQDEGKDDGQ